MPAQRADTMVKLPPTMPKRGSNKINNLEQVSKETQRTLRLRGEEPDLLTTSIRQGG